jgi:hypothetical protein
MLLYSVSVQVVHMVYLISLTEYYLLPRTSLHIHM